ncbi:hypothetical protein WMF30_32565 [Sorangium sp. So ce134]
MALADILHALVHHRVEFIVVGGMAAPLQGAPVNTLDIDIVYARSEENIDGAQPATNEARPARRTGDDRGVDVL